MIWQLIGSFALLLTIFIIIIGNSIRIWYYIKCIKIKKCSKRQCRYREYCHKYAEVLTQQDKERIQMLIDQLREDV